MDHHEFEELPPPLVAALGYARKGWPVFPVNPGNKRPLTRFGLKDATTEAKQIRAWWERWPEAMIGLRTGPAADIFVLDVDTDPGKGIDGFASLALLEREYGALPRTLRSVTPRGGSHYFFRWHVGIKNSAGKLGMGLDVRGDGGYVVLPPSRRVDGRSYEWTESSAAAPCEALPWLVDLATRQEAKSRPTGNGDAHAYARTALERECAAVAMVQPGARNDTLNRAAFCLFKLVAIGALSESEVRNRLFSASVACGLVRDDGRDTVLATIESARTAAYAKQRTNSNHASGAADTEQHPHTLILNRQAPLDTAKKFIGCRFTHNGVRTLHYHNGDFFIWAQAHYPLAEEAVLKAEVYDFLNGATCIGTGKERRFLPNRNRVGDAMDALKAAAILPHHQVAPCWLDHAFDLSAKDIIACKNGLLHLPTLDLLNHTPAFFTHNALDFAYDAVAPPPHQWLRFLSQLWPSDQQSIDTHAAGNVWLFSYR